MGALALPIPWIPEDDLLLKNAIEAGASLESLAKGAVQFSRRFTVKELQDRWLALLYDPHISTRAAEQMVELERSAASLSSKSNRADNSKGNKNAIGKRKVESVRSCYYAMRKRICNEPLNPSDLSFPGDNCFMSGVGPPVPDEMLGDPMNSHFGGQEADLDEFFPPVTRDGAPPCAVNEYHMEEHNTYGHMEQNTTLSNHLAIEEPSGHSIFERSGIQENHGCNSRGIIYSGFEENTIFNPSMSDCENSLHHLQCTSPPPAMSDWKSLEGLSVTEMPGDLSIRGKKVQSGDPFVIADDGDGGGMSEYDVMHTEPELNSQISTGCAEGYFNDLFDLSENEMLMIGGVKETFEGLSSLLLDSPNDVTEDKLPSVLKVKDPAAADTYIDVPSSTGLGEKNNSGETQLGDSNVQSSTDPQMPTSAACVNSSFPEFRDGVICCTLNMEDQEIPCNDHVVFPSKPRPASNNRRTQNDINNPSSHSKDNAGIQSSGKGPGMMKREPKRSETCTNSLSRGPDLGMNRAVDEFGARFDKSRAETSAGLRSSSNGYGVPCQSSQAVKKEPSELPLARQPSCGVADKPGQIVDLCHLPTAVGGTNEESQTLSALRNQELHVPGSADYMATEPGGEPLLSDPEEQYSESDADIPDFSDVESMILDMDLGPEDQDLFCGREVAKYQREDVKRAIMRLEQNAHSYMQRAIASHGAFAILYGRHSKHYIKKPEILLGRATEEAPVDIDLGREGHSNTISRKQAIIKMDKDGAFILCNYGKSPIFVNSSEVPRGHTFTLLSNCVVEIRGMPFIFETNQARVKQYLENAAQKLEDKRLNN